MADVPSTASASTAIVPAAPAGPLISGDKDGAQKLLLSLQSTICPSCGKTKESNRALCQGCNQGLPPHVRTNLGQSTPSPAAPPTQAISPIYVDLLYTALAHLGVTKFLTAPKGA